MTRVYIHIQLSYFIKCDRKNITYRIWLNILYRKLMSRKNCGVSNFESESRGKSLMLVNFRLLERINMPGNGNDIWDLPFVEWNIIMVRYSFWWLTFSDDFIHPQWTICGLYFTQEYKSFGYYTYTYSVPLRCW